MIENYTLISNKDGDKGYWIYIEFSFHNHQTPNNIRLMNEKLLAFGAFSCQVLIKHVWIVTNLSAKSPDIIAVMISLWLLFLNNFTSFLFLFSSVQSLFLLIYTSIIDDLIKENVFLLSYLYWYLKPSKNSISLFRYWNLYSTVYGHISTITLKIQFDIDFMI